MKPYNSRTYGSEVARRLVFFGAVIIVIIALLFAAFRLDAGALGAAVGTLAVVALMTLMAWGALQLIEWLGGRE